MKITDQVVLISGGASGMGRACAERFNRLGMKPVILDQNTKGCEYPAFQVDVSSAEAVEQAIEKIVNTIGAPRVCVNCAGIAPAKKMLGKDGIMPLASFKTVIDVNLIGTFNVMRVAANAMSKLEPLDESEERGVIINTASIAAYEGQIGQTAYSASKGGVVAMTLPAARELAYFGIRVNAIAPGLIATPMLLSMPQEVQESLTNTMLFPKRFGQPDEFAALVQHLIENTMINGEVVRLDGALRMQPK